MAQDCTIDPKGNVRLILDGGTLRVSRKVLCLSSPVFQAMLGGDAKFFEASKEAVGEDGVRNVQLGDDKFDVMQILLRTIHLQNDTVPKKISFEQLTQIAVLCDKYSLRECLLPWFSVWSQPHLGSIEKEGFESWLSISSIFRDEGIFSRITRHLILYGSLPSNNAFVKSDTKFSGVSDDIMDQIRLRRASTLKAVESPCRILFSRLLYNQPKTVCGLEKQTQCDRSNLGCLMQTLPHLVDANAQAAVDSGSIMSLVLKIQNARGYGSELTFHQWGVPHNTASHGNCSLKNILLPQVMAVVKAVQGLSLPRNPDKKREHDDNEQAAANKAQKL